MHSIYIHVVYSSTGCVLAKYVHCIAYIHVHVLHSELFKCCFTMKLHSNMDCEHIYLPYMSLIVSIYTHSHTHTYFYPLPSYTHPHPLTPSHPHTPSEERRLFVGMLCKELSEEDVKSLFLPHGHVEDVSILRSADGRSKGNNGRGVGDKGNHKAREEIVNSWSENYVI